MDGLLSILPASWPGISTALAAALGIAGGMLWIAGACFSRSLVTLLLVAAGTWLGLRLPGWCGAHIDGMGPAIGGAVLLGTAGYTLHRAWIGLVLAVMLAAWAGTGAWLGMHHRPGTAESQYLDAPHETVSVSASSLSAVEPGVIVKVIGAALGDGESDTDGQNYWAISGAMLRQRPIQIMLAAATLGLFAGGILAVRYPRLSGALAWSLVGITLAMVMGGAVVCQSRPQRLGRLSGHPLPLSAALLALLAIGTATQYWLAGWGERSQIPQELGYFEDEP